MSIDHNDHNSTGEKPAKQNWRFAAMVLTGAVVMCATTHAGTWEWATYGSVRAGSSWR